MRFVFPTAGLNVSGGVRNLLVQANALAVAGHQVSIVVPDFASESPFRLASSVRLRRLATGPKNWPLRWRKLVYYLRLALGGATAGADACLVAFFLTAYCVAASNLFRGRKALMIYSVAAYEPFTHGTVAEGRWLGRRLRSHLALLSYRLPGEKMYASAWLRAAVGDDAGYVLGRGIDLDIFRPAPARAMLPELRIGVIGRSGPVKGYADFITAIETLQASRPVRVHILALDPVPKPTRFPVEMVAPGGQKAMAAFYSDCDIFVFPSLSEGFPAPPLEAMACGCAVLATACGGISEYASDGVNCLVVPPGDPASLREGLARLCCDPSLRSRLAQAGSETATRFDQQQMAKRLVEWLNDRLKNTCRMSRTRA